MTGLGSARALHSTGSRFLHLTYSCPLCVLAPRSFGLCTVPHGGVRWGWGSVHLSSDRISSGRGADVIAGTTRLCSGPLIKSLGCKVFCAGFYLCYHFLNCFCFFLPLYSGVFMPNSRHMAAQSKFIMYFLNKPNCGH